jgi:translocation and assembly module TamB
VVALGVLVVNSPIGHRFVVERIMRYAPASGMRISIGRIDGSLYGKARLKDVVISDPQGAAFIASKFVAENKDLEA